MHFVLVPMLSQRQRMFVGHPQRRDRLAAKAGRPPILPIRIRPRATRDPCVSGINHAAAWPVERIALLRNQLDSTPPSFYSFAASEARWLLRFILSRVQVRRWVLADRVAHASPLPRANAAVTGLAGAEV